MIYLLYGAENKFGNFIFYIFCSKIATIELQHEITDSGAQKLPHKQNVQEDELTIPNKKQHPLDHNYCIRDLTLDLKNSADSAEKVTTDWTKCWSITTFENFKGKAALTWP